MSAGTNEPRELELGEVISFVHFRISQQVASGGYREAATLSLLADDLTNKAHRQEREVGGLAARVSRSGHLTCFECDAPLAGPICFNCNPVRVT